MQSASVPKSPRGTLSVGWVKGFPWRQARTREQLAVPLGCTKVLEMERILARPALHRLLPNRGWFCKLCVTLILVAPATVVAQTAPATPSADFTKLAGKLTADRAVGTGESEATETQALEILDRAALEQLNAAAVNLDTLNQHLAAFVTHQPPIGESYRVVRLSADPVAYALVANFGLSGPSAVRLYAGTAGHFALTARLDPFAQKDFFDDYIDLVPLAGSGGLFLTISGRTDDLKTGIFTAWQFDGKRVAALWTSDILEQSEYEVATDGLQLTYCGESDPNDFRVCKQMQRDRYAWQNGAWKRVETGAAPIVAAKP
jgi:hypothetical protein